jgi:hypothetical protein
MTFDSSSEPFSNRQLFEAHLQQLESHGHPDRPRAAALAPDRPLTDDSIAAQELLEKRSHK